MNLNITITGGAGYIGSILTAYLLEKGERVTVVDTYHYNQTTLVEHCHNPKFTLIVGDARDKRVIHEAIEHADIIIPLAAVVGAPASDRDKIGAHSLNYEAVELINKLRMPDQAVLYPTTNSGYGVGQDGIMCDENAPMNPLSLYARDKVAAEKLLLDTGNVITFRLATVFGFSPRMRLDLLVNDFTYRAVHDGFIVLFEHGFKRNYIHVRDVARVFYYGIKGFDVMKNNAYNVGLSNANLSKLELCEKIKEVVPRFVIKTDEYTKDLDQRNYIVSNAKIEATGYRPMYELGSGIIELVKGFRALRNNKFTNV